MADATNIASGDKLKGRFGQQKGDHFITVDNLFANVAVPLGVGKNLKVSEGASTAAAGAAQANAANLPAGTALYYPTTAADGTKGVIINAADVVSDRIIIVGNGAAAVLKIYPTTAGTINNGSANAAFSTASGKGAIMLCTNATAGSWLAWS